MSLTPETIKTLDDQVREIARHLEMEFDEEYAGRREGNWNYHAEIWKGNKRISFSALDFTGKTRLAIRAVFPRDKRGQVHNGGYNVKTPEITVAMNRGQEKIARAIETRLLPEYEKQLAVALENIERSKAYHEVRLQPLKAVAEYFGQPVPEDNDKAIYPKLIGTGRDMGIYKIETCSEGVKFDVSCDMQKAIKIFDVLKEVRK